MAQQMKMSRADVWAGDIADEPGGLSRVLAALAEARASVECVVARRKSDGSGAGDVFVSPVKGKRAQDAARQAGLTPMTDVPTLRVEGADAPGLGARLTQAIADAGINVRGLTAAVVGRSYVAYIGFDSQDDADRASKAIRSAAARPRSRAGGRATRGSAPRAGRRAARR